MKITNDIYAVGAVDRDLRKFHGYSTPFGTTYNAYLITGDKNVLVDTVKSYCAGELLEKISRIIPPGKIDYIIANHAEMDHSGSIPEMLRAAPSAEIVCSPKCRENILMHFRGLETKFRVVDNGETLSVGNRTLRFLHAPMVHWPDSMAAYLEEDRILFSNDAFGQHYGTDLIYADEVGMDIVMKEARKYYANIVNPYGGPVSRVLDALSGIDFSMIAPSHGLVWRRKNDISAIFKKYRAWSSNIPGKKVLIVYDTMWGSTAKMAQECRFAALDAGRNVELFNIGQTDISDAVAEIIDSDLILAGSSILHGQVLPSVAGFFAYLEGLKFGNRSAWTFGSYGWSKNSFTKFEDLVAKAGMRSSGPGFYSRFVPGPVETAALISSVKQILLKE